MSTGLTAEERWAAAAADGPAAIGGTLAPSALLDAYRNGLFPFPTDDPEVIRTNTVLYQQQVADGQLPVLGDPGKADLYGITWWNPDPRPVIPRGGVHLSRSLRRRLRTRLHWSTTCNTAFAEVLEACAEGRTPAWLTDEYRTALSVLHRTGWAHSIEVWEGDELIGGLFGLGFGPIFSADSAFRRRPGAAQVAVADLDARLADSTVRCIDVQWQSPYLADLGAVPTPRAEYLRLLPGEFTRLRLAAGRRSPGRDGEHVAAGSSRPPSTSGK
jgi:leucyl/phenylalanyl-tRNA--protein transferase